MRRGSGQAPGAEESRAGLKAGATGLASFSGGIGRIGIGAWILRFAQNDTVRRENNETT